MEIQKKISDKLNEALGLSMEAFDSTVGAVTQAFEDHTQISEMLKAAAEQVREDELGRVNTDMTTYEKRLILAGMFLGRSIQANQMHSVLEKMLKK